MSSTRRVHYDFPKPITVQEGEEDDDDESLLDDEYRYYRASPVLQHQQPALSPSTVHGSPNRRQVKHQSPLQSQDQLQDLSAEQEQRKSSSSQNAEEDANVLRAVKSLQDELERLGRTLDDDVKLEQLLERARRVKLTEDDRYDANLHPKQSAEHNYHHPPPGNVTTATTTTPILRPSKYESSHVTTPTTATIRRSNTQTHHHISPRARPPPTPSEPSPVQTPAHLLFSPEPDLSSANQAARQSSQTRDAQDNDNDYPSSFPSARRRSSYPDDQEYATHGSSTSSTSVSPKPTQPQRLFTPLRTSAAAEPSAGASSTYPDPREYRWRESTQQQTDFKDHAPYYSSLSEEPLRNRKQPDYSVTAQTDGRRRMQSSPSRRNDDLRAYLSQLSRELNPQETPGVDHSQHHHHDHYRSYSRQSSDRDDGGRSTRQVDAREYEPFSPHQPGTRLETSSVYKNGSRSHLSRESSSLQNSAQERSSWKVMLETMAETLKQQDDRMTLLEQENRDLRALVHQLRRERQIETLASPYSASSRSARGDSVTDSDRTAHSTFRSDNFADRVYGYSPRPPPPSSENYEGVPSEYYSPPTRQPPPLSLRSESVRVEQDPRLRKTVYGSSRGTEFVLDLSSKIDLPTDVLAPLSIIMDKHFDREAAASRNRQEDYVLN